MKVIKSSQSDLEEITKCHMTAFSSSLSTKLGSDLSSKMLEWYIVSERGVLFHVSIDDEVVGYCGGVITKDESLDGATSNITQYVLNTMVVSYLRKPWLFLHHSNIKKVPIIIRNILIRLGLKKLNSKSVKENSQTFKSFWGVIVIGVNPKFQSKGVGSVILKEFENKARFDGVDTLRLSVKPENQHAINLYTKLGWKVISTTQHSLGLAKNINPI